MKAFAVVGSPGFPTELDVVVANAARAYDRGYDPLGIARQAIASLASGDRTKMLHYLKIPTLVIHGLDDSMCDVSGGRATAEAIPQSKLVLIKGLGHNLPPGLWPEIAEHIAGIVRIAETQIRR